MSIFIKEMIRAKLRQLTPGELLKYSRQYGFSITEQQAGQIVGYLRQHNPDPFSSASRAKMFQALETITNSETAHQTQQLFEKMIASYGMQHLFE